MTNVDHDNQKPVRPNEVNDAIDTDTIGVAASELAFEGFALIGVQFKLIKGSGQPTVERRVASRDSAQDAFSNIGEFEPITWQGNA